MALEGVNLQPIHADGEVLLKVDIGPAQPIHHVRDPGQSPDAVPARPRAERPLGESLVVNILRPQANREVGMRVNAVGLVARMVGQGERGSSCSNAPLDQVLPAGKQPDAHEGIGETMRPLVEPFGIAQL